MSLPSPPDEKPPSGHAGRRAELLAFLEIWALCGLAVAQPVLDVTGRAPDFFLFHRAGAVEILLFVALVTAVPPLLLWGAGALSALAGHRLRRVVHLATVAALTATLAVQAGKLLSPLRGPILAGLALVATALFVAAYVRWPVLPRVVRVAAVGPVAFVLLFVLASPTAPLIVGSAGATESLAGRPVGDHPPVVVIVLDEFPQLSLLDDDGDIDAERFPSFARLARDSTWYRNATTLSGSTVDAMPTMLTGRLPLRRTAGHYAHFPRNLFTLVDGTYDVRAYESVTQFCPPAQCTAPRAEAALPTLLGQGMTVLGDVVWPGRSGRNPVAGLTEPTLRAPKPDAADVKFLWENRAANQPVRFQQFVETLRPAPRPTLHFLHLILPHQPFQHLPSGTTYDHAWLEDQPRWLRHFWMERHLLQAQYADRLLGEALDRLRQTGLYDDATVVVTADHGISFHPDTELRAIDDAQRNAAEVAWVPMFIKAPGQAGGGRVDHRNWQHVDLLPTLADYAGVSLPWPVDGVSARGAARATPDKPYYPRPGRPIALDTAGAYRTVLGGPDALPYPREYPRPALAGLRVDTLPTTDSAVRAKVSKADEFARVDPASGVLPALVRGDLPASVPAGRYVAIALNGTIATVVPVMPDSDKHPRFAGLIADEALFRPGANDLALFLVTEDGRGLERLRR